MACYFKKVSAAKRTSRLYSSSPNAPKGPEQATSPAPLVLSPWAGLCSVFPEPPGPSHFASPQSPHSTQFPFRKPAAGNCLHLFPLDSQPFLCRDGCRAYITLCSLYMRLSPPLDLSVWKGEMLSYLSSFPRGPLHR